MIVKSYALTSLRKHKGKKNTQKNYLQHKRKLQMEKFPSADKLTIITSTKNNLLFLSL